MAQSALAPQIRSELGAEPSSSSLLPVGLHRPAPSARVRRRRRLQACSNPLAPPSGLVWRRSPAAQHRREAQGVHPAPRPCSRSVSIHTSTEPPEQSWCAVARQLLSSARLRCARTGVVAAAGAGGGERAAEDGQPPCLRAEVERVDSVALGGLNGYMLLPDGSAGSTSSSRSTAFRLACCCRRAHSSSHLPSLRGRFLCTWRPSPFPSMAEHLPPLHGCWHITQIIP